MASNPAFTKRNIQNANAYLLTILVRSLTLWSRITLYRATWLVLKVLFYPSLSLAPYGQIGENPVNEVVYRACTYVFGLSTL